MRPSETGEDRRLKGEDEWMEEEGCGVRRGNGDGLQSQATLLCLC